MSIFTTQSYFTEFIPSFFRQDYPLLLLYSIYYDARNTGAQKYALMNRKQLISFLYFKHY